MAVTWKVHYSFLHYAALFFALVTAVNALSTSAVPYASPSLSTTTFTNADQQQHDVRELLNLLDSSVRVYTNNCLHLDEVNNPQLVLDACFAVCSAMEQLPNNSNGGASIAAAQMSEKEQHKQQDQAEPALLTHFFEVPLWDAEFESLTSSVKKPTTTTTNTFTDNADDDRDDKILERLKNSADIVAAADIVSASANFMLLPFNAKTNALDALDAALAHEDFLEARTMALTACSRDSKIRHNANPVSWSSLSQQQQQQRNEDNITEKDKEVVEVLYDCVIRQLGPLILTPLGFPCNKLGLRGFVAAARAATSTQRAASALGRIWHAANEAGPLIVIPNPAAAACFKATGSLEDYTLVVAFSALGWNGIVRQEWGGTLRDSKHVVVVHALDSCKSWFMTNPVTGSLDNGIWWDKSLANLAAPFGRVCLVGESMGGTAALRFARHASKSGTVVSLVPQINLKDFPAFSVRDDFDKVHKDRLLGLIKQSLETTSARVVIHVGRNPDDLKQLNHIENTVHEHSVLGLQVDAPLPRYSSQSSHTVGNYRLRVVKHDVEGHAMGAGLKAKGTLRKVILDDLLGSDSWQ